jgi:hypothetical protein
MDDDFQYELQVGKESRQKKNQAIPFIYFLTHLKRKQKKPNKQTNLRKRWWYRNDEMTPAISPSVPTELLFPFCKHRG